MKGSTPTTTWEIEDALTRHYLRADGPFGPATLQYLDATDEELARALSIADPEEARKHLLGSFDPPLVRDVFRSGVAPSAPRDIEGPGYFSYLVLSCVIACTSDEVSQLGDFRQRLAEQLGDSGAFVNIPGVAKLWESLRTWCAKAPHGQYREIVLPDPGFMTQIGYSRRIAFPSRPDVERMARLFGGKSAASLQSVVKMADDELNRHHWSEAFVSAFADFKRRVRLGHRLLMEHPFWLAFEKARRVPHQQIDNSPARIELTTDIEGDTIALLIQNDSTLSNDAARRKDEPVAERLITQQLDIEAVVDYLNATTDNSLAPLVRSVSEGVLPFDQTGLWVWQATRTPDTTKVRLLVRPDIARRYDLRGSQHRWLLTGPLNLEVALEVIAWVRPESMLGRSISRTKIVGGIKVGSNLLGLSCCLPQVYASPECSLSVEPSPGARGTLVVASQDGSSFALASNGPLSGKWDIKTNEGGIRVADAAVRFVPNALEHDFTTTTINQRQWSPDIEIDTESRQVSTIGCGSILGEHTTDDRLPIFDVLEALYAGGERGWAEPDLFPLLHDALVTWNISPWDAIRVLADSGWIEPRLSTSWRARRWYLRPPQLIRLSSTVILLDGAACESARQRFSACVERAGGRVDARVTPGAWCVPILAGIVPPGADIVADAGISAGVANTGLPLPPRPVRFHLSGYTTLARKVAGIWSWSRGRFLASGAPEADLPIVERLQHNENRSNDIYRVGNQDGAPAIFESRVAAILRAHQLANRPLFKFDPVSSLLCRIPSEGWLPTAIATYLRMRHLVGPALIRDRDTSQLNYPTDRDDVANMTVWIGQVISHEETSLRPNLRAELARVVLKRRGLPATPVITDRLVHRC